MKLDLKSFRRWACGNLADNRNRGIFAEWLVGVTLGVVGDDEPRREWDACDWRYRDRGVEVKAAGFGQSWSQREKSTPRFSIEKQKWAWDAKTNTGEDCDPPRRTAAVYVFCLHDQFPATNDNVADPSSWKFWVVATVVIDEQLGEQGSLGLATLNTLADPVPWRGLRAAVDAALDEK